MWSKGTSEKMSFTDECNERLKVLKYVAHLQGAGVVVHWRVFPGFVSFLVCVFFVFLFFFVLFFLPYLFWLTDCWANHRFLHCSVPSCNLHQRELIKQMHWCYIFFMIKNKIGFKRTSTKFYPYYGIGLNGTVVYIYWTDIMNLLLSKN